MTTTRRQQENKNHKLIRQPAEHKKISYEINICSYSDINYNHQMRNKVKTTVSSTAMPRRHAMSVWCNTSFSQENFPNMFSVSQSIYFKTVRPL